jgi:large subunit ribosomal protein L22
MISNAKLRYLRISPRKVRMVVNLIRGKKVEEAQVILNFARKKATLPILKLLQQAIFNAKDKQTDVKEEELYVSEIFVDEGPSYKRTFPRSRGKADIIQKRSSHITITIDNIGNKKKKGAKKTTKPAEVEKVKSKKESKKKTEAKKVLKKEIVVTKKKEKDREDKKPEEKAKWRPETKKFKAKSQKGTKRFFRRKAI